MGIVYRATDTQLNRPVAVKVPTTSTGSRIADRRLFRQKRFAEAREFLEEERPSTDPNNSGRWTLEFLMADIAEELGDADTAVVWLEKVLERELPTPARRVVLQRWTSLLVEE